MRKEIAIIGADPGKKGAISCVFFSKEKLSLEYLKIEHVSAEPKIFYSTVFQAISNWKSRCAVIGCALEMPFGLMRQGNQISYGRYFGHLELTLELSHNESPTLYYPTQWQPLLMPRIPGSKAKELSSFAFRSLFNLPQELSEHDGVVDATCIALAHAVKLGVFPKSLINWQLFAEQKGITYEPKRRRKTTPKKRLENI